MTARVSPVWRWARESERLWRQLILDGPCLLILREIESQRPDQHIPLQRGFHEFGVQMRIWRKLYQGAAAAVAGGVCFYAADA